MQEHKPRPPGLYNIVLNRLKNLERSNNSSIIRFPKVFEKICVSLQVNKKQAWMLLFELRDSGMIEIVRNNGIRILNKTQDS